MNALDLALNGAVQRNALADAASIVSQLVTAGATMTGNSKAYQNGTTPHHWRRFHDRGASNSDGGGGGGPRAPRASAAAEANLRRTQHAAGRVADDDYEVTTGYVKVDSSGGEVAPDQ